jgi:hypothetical protein
MLRGRPSDSKINSSRATWFLLLKMDILFTFLVTHFTKLIGMNLGRINANLQQKQNIKKAFQPG